MMFYHFQLKKAVFGLNFGKKISNRGEKAPRPGHPGPGSRNPPHPAAALVADGNFCFKKSYFEL